MTGLLGRSKAGSSPKRQPPPITVEPSGGKWQRLSPRSAEGLLGRTFGSGDFGETLTPGGSPRFSSRGRPDSRRRILLNMTFANLFLALVLLIIGGVGPAYPGHSGTTDNAFTDGNNRRLTTQDNPLYKANCPTEEVDSANASVLHSALIVGLVIWLTQPCSARRISDQVDRAGAAATLLTSVVCAFTCLGAFTVTMLDISYVANCCSLLEDNCEVSNLCTEFVDDCCISDDVKEYCGNPSYHVGAVSMIFLVFVSTSAMMIMACTMTCRCWLDSDPDKQAMMMVLSGGTPMAHTPAHLSSPRFSPRDKLLSTTGTGRASSPSSPHQRTAWGERSVEGGRGNGPSAASVSTRERCPHCGAIFGDAVTLVNHVERFHKGASARVTGERTDAPNGAGAPQRKPLTRKSSLYTPDEAPAVQGSGGGVP